MSKAGDPPTSRQAAPARREAADADRRRFRNALGTFATGVTIVSTRSADAVHGMTANGFMSVSLEPALVVVSLAQGSRMHELLRETGRYGVSVLSRDQEGVSRHFAGQEERPYEIAFREVAGVPLIEDALTHVAAGVAAVHHIGDHSLFVGEVQYFDHRAGDPLIFHCGEYRALMDWARDPVRSQEWIGELHSWGLDPLPRR